MQQPISASGAVKFLVPRISYPTYLSVVVGGGCGCGRARWQSGSVPLIGPLTIKSTSGLCSFSGCDKGETPVSSLHEHKFQLNSIAGENVIGSSNTRISKSTV